MSHKYQWSSQKEQKFALPYSGSILIMMNKLKMFLSQTIASLLLFTVLYLFCLIVKIANTGTTATMKQICQHWKFYVSTVT